jgi:uncharacterized protein (TIGR00251 family)
VSLPCLRQTDAGVEVFLYIQPRASRNKVIGLQGEALKISLTAPPVDGAANSACCAFLAKLFNLSKARVRLVSGESSRHKRCLLEDADFKEIFSLVNAMVGLDIHT